MLRNILWVILFGLIVGGCASDGKTVSSDASSSMSSGGAASSTPTTSNSVVAESNPTMSQGGGSETMTATTPADSGVTIRSRQSENRIAAGIDEETLETCLAHIPQDATTGQKMLAEQTCRRNFATRR